MRTSHRPGFALSICLAVTGIVILLYIDSLWVAVAGFADAQTRPAATVGQYIPPPGPIYLDNDAYCWLGYAQRIAQGEDWRIRHTNLDGFPTGREVHWSQVVSWTMVLGGKLRSFFTHETLHDAIERASVAINPVLYAAAAAGLFAALAKRFGTWPAALFTAFLSSSGDVGWTFQPLRPGHQGFHLVLGAISVVTPLCGGMGLVTRERTGSTAWSMFRPLGAVDPDTARRCFLLAGFGTGLALWVSATIESFFLYPLVAALAASLALIPRGKVVSEHLAVQPDLWRWWGVMAGITGFACYLLEYFPQQMAMRLEVNHPVYDLAVIGLGEGMRMLTRLRWGGVPATPVRILAAAGFLAIGALPVLAILCGPMAWHHLRDPQMLRLHNFIHEFYTYSNLIETHRLGHLFKLYGILPIVSLLGPLLLLRKASSVPQVMWLAGSFILAGSFALAAFLQIRWMGFYAAAACLSALVAGHSIYDAIPKGHWLRQKPVASIVIVALLIQPAEFYRRQIVDLQIDLRGVAIEKEFIIPILNKRLAYDLKASPEGPKAVIADPSIAPSLGYFAGIPCLVSFYWENLDGLHEATRFFATQDPAEAHAVALRCGATHVIIPSGETLPNYFYFIANGRYDPAGVRHTFADRLLAGTTPLWIQSDTVLNFITTKSYSYRGARLSNRLETFRVEE